MTKNAPHRLLYLKNPILEGKGEQRGEIALLSLNAVTQPWEMCPLRTRTRLQAGVTSPASLKSQVLRVSSALM